jgi:hypothetical protein
MNRRMTRGRRLLLGVVATLGVLTWLIAVLTWPSFGRVTESGGFADVTVETIQSPAGLTGTADAVVTVVDAYAIGKGSSLSVAGESTLRGAVQSLLSQPDIGTLLVPAIDQARTRFEDRPDGGVTINLGAVRERLVTALDATAPQLASQIPPARDLTVTVTPEQVPSGVSTAAGALNTLRLLPLWLAIATIVLLGIGVLVTDDRARMARRLGIAFIAVGIVPILLRLIVPPIVGGAVGEGNAGDIATAATVATVANWWIALIVTVVIGVAMLVTGMLLRRPARARRVPIVLGR